MIFNSKNRYLKNDFMELPSKEEHADYYEIIKTPLSLNTITVSHIIYIYLYKSNFIGYPLFNIFFYATCNCRKKSMKNHIKLWMNLNLILI